MEEPRQMDERRRKLMMMMHKALHPKDDGDYRYQEKEEEDLPELKIVWIHQYKDSRTTLKRAKKD